METRKLADIGFLQDKAPMTTAMYKDTIKWISCASVTRMGHRTDLHVFTWKTVAEHK